MTSNYLRLSNMKIRTLILCIASFILGSTLTISFISLDSISRNTYLKHDEQQQQPLLLVLIMSDPKNLNQRDVIRRTWVSLFENDEKYFFVIGTKNLDSKTLHFITKENNYYNDILELNDFQDSYSSLTVKLIKSLNLIKNMKFKYLLKCDDDTYIHTKNFVSELSLLSDTMSTLYWGFFRGDAKVKKHGKWKENDWNLCDTYLPYALGGGYVISQDLVHFIINNSNKLKIFNNEDVSVGAWLSSITTNKKHDPRFNTEYISRGCRNSYLVIHKQSPKLILELHHNLQTLGKLCINEYQNLPSFEYNWNELPSKCCVRTNKVI